ncbi:MAG: tripartite tricarboxylate transporter substrate-binding protein [Alphaproteobacteria bacterium]|nr:tripartite tricarboxylate transporter substrate-binding protein [Alphaproteobacteria bacterium]
MPDRRALLVLPLAAPAIAAAQPRFPERPLRVVVPRAPGGGTDILIRALAPGVSARLGQPVVVENRADATTIVGSEHVARSAPDGLTILAADNALYFNPAIIPRLPYDTLADFAAITLLAEAPVVLIIGRQVPATNLAELIALARAQPGRLSFASGGVGASTHFAGVLFALRAGIDLIHVPYRSSGPALTALLSGEVTMNFGGFAASGQLIRAGQVLALAKTAQGVDPAIPTFAEAGLPGVDVASIWGLHAPAGTPLPIRETIREAFRAAAEEPETRARLEQMGYQPIFSTPVEHARQTRAVIEQWMEIGRRVNLNQ